MHTLKTAAFLLILSTHCFAQSNDSLSPEVEALLQRANAGEPEAQFLLATAYDWGDGAPRNGAEALRWYESAANSGHSEAQNSMGSALQAAGRYDEAFLWYERAAKQNHALAINNLADLYNLGRGVSQDRSRAYELFLRSAELGWDEAMWNIANLHGAGNIGEKEDFLMACIWATRAISHTQRGSAVFHRATRGLSYAESKLRRKERAECRHKAREWSPTLRPNNSFKPTPLRGAA
jgi:TPR repeat protein